MQELVKLFYKINIQGMDNFFGITSNQSMYTQGEFGGITQELVQPDGKITRNWGDNLIPLNFLKNWQNYLIKLIATEGTMFYGITSNLSMYNQVEFWGITQKLFQPDDQTSLY